MRLIASLPSHWGAILLGCTHGSAAIAITPSDGLPLTQVLDAVDAALTAPALSGWVRVETPSSLNSAH
ncbi:hypothetical protein ABZT23_39450 [Streptomyces sp. NPDC005386]|uniref:hypothetical protein n=1 Tax=Streptomyces sp. NPDC005386 TaxID=3154562 RepID=UPI0033B71A4E